MVLCLLAHYWVFSGWQVEDAWEKERKEEAKTWLLMRGEIRSVKRDFYTVVTELGAEKQHRSCLMSHPAPLSPAESSRAPLGTVLQRLLEPSSEPLPLEDLILWQACSKTNHQAPTTFHTSVCSTCASSSLCSPSLPRGHHITWLPTHGPCYPLAAHSRQHGHPTHWTHACICFCSDRSLSPEGPVSQFLPAGTLVILQFCHYPYPTAFPGPPEVKTNHSPFHVFTVFCIHHFSLKFPIASLPATSGTTSSWR